MVVESARYPGWLRGIFIANLIAQTGIVVTGGLVRLTGSGLGCPTWPQCTPGSYVPVAHQAEAFHKYIEFGNRTLTSVLTLLALAALIGALIFGHRLKKANRPTRPAITWLAVVPLAGTFAQAILGGITVLTGLHPGIVALHFLVSALLIAACTVLVVRANEPGDAPIVVLVRPAIRTLGIAMVCVAFVVLTLGTVVTGSGPHSGDDNTGGRFPFDPRSASWIHADLVLLFVGLTIGMLVALYATSAPRRTIAAAWILAGTILLQGAIGYTQYFTGLPRAVVALHLLGACLVWIAVLWLLLSLRSRGVELSPASSE